MSSFVHKGEIFVRIGARGEHAGRSDEWDEACCGGVAQILITHGYAVNSIQVVHNHIGTLVLSHRRGGDGDNFDCVNLDAPWEFLTGVSGSYGPVNQLSGGTAVRSLSFTTNRTTYGPFGRGEGTAFAFRFRSGVAFGGFHGRSCRDYLRSIGIYVRSQARRHVKPEPPQHKALPLLCSMWEDSSK